MKLNYWRSPKLSYEVVLANSFKKDLKLLIKRGYDIALLGDVVNTLAEGMPLAAKYHNHTLKGNYNNCQECHITPDWLLIYEIVNDELVLRLTRTGTHSDLFG